MTTTKTYYVGYCPTNDKFCKMSENSGTIRFKDLDEAEFFDSYQECHYWVMSHKQEPFAGLYAGKELVVKKLLITIEDP